MVEPLEPAQQARLDEESRSLMQRRTSAACILAMCLAPLYIVSDYFLYPEQILSLGVWRVACLVLTAAILFGLRSPLGRAHPDWLSFVLGIEISLMVSGMQVLVVGYTTPYAVGFVLVVLAMALLMPWRMSYGVALSGALAAIYVGAALIHGEIDSVSLLLTHTALIITAGVVAVVSVQASASLRAREFRTRLAMEAALHGKSDLTAALEEKTTQLELVNQEMQDLLYVASHDMRAPLINVQGFTRELQLSLDELRRAQPPTPETQALFTDVTESIQFINTAIARMDGLIGSLLNISRIATRTNPTEIVPLAPMVDKIIDSFRYQLEQKQIAIAVADLPEVIGDPVRLNQALSNLIDNAIKYMGDRPVRRIEIGACSANGMSACYVRDSGPGIPKAKHEAIFRLFQRLGGGSVPGEGIGLTMVRKIIEKHGGRIWVEATPGEGSTFWFTVRTASPAPHAGPH